MLRKSTKSSLKKNTFFPQLFNDNSLKAPRYQDCSSSPKPQNHYKVIVSSQAQTIQKETKILKKNRYGAINQKRQGAKKQKRKRQGDISLPKLYSPKPEINNNNLQKKQEKEHSQNRSKSKDKGKPQLMKRSLSNIFKKGKRDQFNQAKKQTNPQTTPKIKNILRKLSEPVLNRTFNHLHNPAQHIQVKQQPCFNNQNLNKNGVRKMSRTMSRTMTLEKKVSKQKYNYIFPMPQTLSDRQTNPNTEADITQRSNVRFQSNIIHTNQNTLLERNFRHDQRPAQAIDAANLQGNYLQADMPIYQKEILDLVDDNSL